MRGSVRARAEIGRVSFLLSAVLAIILVGPGPAQALDVMLPQVYQRGMNIAGWLASEKLDGVRGYWDGSRLYSKNGALLSPPPAFTANFPDFPLEGEIWGGRNTFEKTVSIVTREKEHDGWLELKFAVFDAPAAPGGFESRLQIAAAWFATHPAAHAFVIEHRPIAGGMHLQEELKRVEEAGGEGLILRRPGSPYSKGRSEDILKVKSYDDAEAVVIAHLPGQGRNQGRMGALLVELPDGTRFRLGSGFTDREREDPPSLGALVTFKHYGFHPSGVPRFPSYVRIRKDP